MEIYTVVEVWRGIAQGARSFTRLKDARKHMRSLRRRFNPLEDDVKMFRNALRLSR